MCIDHHWRNSMDNNSPLAKYTSNPIIVGVVAFILGAIIF